MSEQNAIDVKIGTKLGLSLLVLIGLLVPWGLGILWLWGMI